MESRARPRRAGLSRASRRHACSSCSSRTSSACIEQANLPGTTEHASELAAQASRCRSSAGPRTRASLRSRRRSRTNGRARGGQPRLRPASAPTMRDTARHLPPAAQSRVHVRRRDGARSLSGRARRQPRVLLAVPARAPRAACTATTSSITARSIRRSAAARISTGSSRRSTPTAWAIFATSCPITSASWAPTIAGGWTCWRTVRRRRMPDYFDIDWEPLDPELAGRVLVPVLGDPYGVRARARRTRARVRGGGGRLRRPLL